MKLRARLALTALAGTMVITLSVSWVTSVWRAHQADGFLASAIEAAMGGEGRARCEADPAGFGGGNLEPLPPLFFFGAASVAPAQLFAYDATFRSAHPSAPPFPESLRVALADVQSRAGGAFATPSSTGRQLAARMPWGGPCAVVLARFSALALPESTRFLRGAFAVLTIGTVSFLAFGTTITRIRRLAAAVKASADSTYAVGVPVTGSDEIGELEVAFNRASEQVRSHMTTIQEREAALRAVVSNTTHDVAVPLTVVQGHLSSLYALVPPGPAREELRGAIREAQYLAGLLHNLGIAARLDLAEADLPHRVVRIEPLVERVMARHRALAHTLGVELACAVPEEPVHVRADVTLLEQAASNLVHNALHYNRPGGHVAVVLDRLDGGRRFRLRVLDDGPGIPAEERARLTERNFRGAAARAKRPEGQGLGLHIVREVVERHGFTLQVGESDEGGAEVTIAGTIEEPIEEAPPAFAVSRP